MDLVADMAMLKHTMQDTIHGHLILGIVAHQVAVGMVEHTATAGVMAGVIIMVGTMDMALIMATHMPTIAIAGMDTMVLELVEAQAVVLKEEQRDLDL